MNEKRIRPVGFLGKDILAIEEAEVEALRRRIESDKVAFKTVYHELENAREAIEERNALIEELAIALSERLKADKVRPLLDRVRLALAPSAPQRRAAEMDVQGSIGRHEMER